MKQRHLEAFRLSVVKPKPKQPQQPIIARKISQGADKNSKWKQANRLRRGQHASDHVATSFSFESDWLREWHEFLDQSHNKIKRNQSNPGLLSSLNWEFLYQTIIYLESMSDFDHDHRKWDID